MTDEVEVKDEADWAMDYAREYALRIKTEQRLASFMVDAPALCNAVDRLIDAIFEPAAQGKKGSAVLGKQFLKAMCKAMQYNNDLGNNININIFDPVWEISDEEQQQLREARCLADIPRAYRKRVDAQITAANTAVYEQWCDICEEVGHFKTPDQVQEQSIERAQELLSSVMRLKSED